MLTKLVAIPCFHHRDLTTESLWLFINKVEMGRELGEGRRSLLALCIPNAFSVGCSDTIDGRIRGSGRPVGIVEFANRRRSSLDAIDI